MCSADSSSRRIAAAARRALSASAPGTTHHHLAVAAAAARSGALAVLGALRRVRSPSAGRFGGERQVGRQRAALDRCAHRAPPRPAPARASRPPRAAGGGRARRSRWRRRSGRRRAPARGRRSRPVVDRGGSSSSSRKSPTASSLARAGARARSTSSAISALIIRSRRGRRGLAARPQEQVAHDHVGHAQLDAFAALRPGEHGALVGRRRAGHGEHARRGIDDRDARVERPPGGARHLGQPGARLDRLRDPPELVEQVQRRRRGGAVGRGVHARSVGPGTPLRVDPATSDVGRESLRDVRSGILALRAS